MPKVDWEDRYVTGDLPWDTGRPSDFLTDLVSSGQLAPCRVLEVGCGTGTNAIWLKQRGFDVVAIDLSPHAIGLARAKAAAEGIEVRLEVADVLAAEVPGGPYGFAFDRGVWHVFDHHEQRALFAQRVATALEPGGLWLSLLGSTDGPPRDHGPPRRSARDVAAALEPSLELRELRSVTFDADLPTSARAWLCLAEKRVEPAQPSTVRG